MIWLVLYFIGAGITYWLVKSDGDDLAGEPASPRDTHEHAIMVAMSLIIALIWPLFWILCLTMAFVSRVVRP